MSFLLDANVLISLLDPHAIFHRSAANWFESEGAADWSTSAITELAVIRVLLSPAFPGRLSSESVIRSISKLKELGNHEYLASTISPLDADYFDANKWRARGSTDTYLLGLAAHHGRRLATFDRKLDLSGVVGGERWVFQIPT